MGLLDKEILTHYPKKPLTIPGDKVLCAKCEGICRWKVLKKPSRAQLFKQNYYFKKWYHCRCGYWGRLEEDKIYNDNHTKAFDEFRSTTDSIFKNI